MNVIVIVRILRRTFALLLALSAAMVQAAPLITEFMASNSSTLADEDGEFSDWIEIFNPDPHSVNLFDWSLTDDDGELAKWRFPATNVPPRGYLVVFASNKNRRHAGAPLHTNFKLNSTADFLALVDATGTNVVSQFSPCYPPQVPDVSYGLGVETASRILLSTGSPARVFLPTNNSLGAAWTLLDYDDAAWRAATNGIGFETGAGEYPAGAAVSAIYAADPLLYLRLGETSGTMAANQGALGTAANGTCLNGVALAQAGVRPPAYPGFEPDNTAARFDGMDDKIDVPFLPALNQNTFTVEVWAMVNGGAGAYRSPVTSRDDSPQRGYVFYAANNNLWQFWTGTGSGWHSLTGPAVVLGQWEHLVGTFDGTTKSFYVNGTLAASAAATVSLNTARPLRIGGGATEGAGNYFFNGDIDEVAVYGRALTAAEVLEHYQAATLASTAPTNFYFTNEIRTDLRGAMYAVNSSVYLRFPFVVTNLAEVDRLTLRMKYDDGFVAWLNGQAAAAANAPATPEWNSAATARHPNSAAVVCEETDLSDLRGVLRPGTNVLAIQGLNWNATNADFLIQPELVLTTGGAMSPSARYFRQPTPGGLNGLGTADLGPIITRAGFTPALPAKPLDADDLTVTARVSQAFSPVANVTLNYRVAFGDTNVLPMLDDGLHGDGAPNDGVYGAIIPASASAPGQMVRWFLASADTAGNVSRWPLFEQRLNSPEYVGTVVENPAVTGALPVFEWFAQDTAAAHTRAGTRGAVLWQGEFYDNVFIRQRGGYTVGAISQKFDFNTGYHFKVNDEVGRVEEINLNANGLDASYVRPPLAFEVFRGAGHPAPVSFHMRLRVNNAEDRVGIFVEQVDERFLERHGFDPQGALYKFVQRATLLPAFNDVTDGLEKKTRLTEDFSDLQVVVTGARLTNNIEARAAFLFDAINLANFANYFACRAVIRDVDDVRKNWYCYRDTRGAGEWRLFPWDKDYCLGTDGDGGVMTRHPFFGDYAHRKPNAEQWNYLWEAFFNEPRTREMYLRRLRTVMDQQLGPVNYLEGRADAWFAASASLLGATPASALATLKTNDIPKRRTELFVSFAATNVGAGVDALIPGPQRTSLYLGFGAVDFNPVSGNQLEEYVQLANTNLFAVDLSGWRLEGAVRHVFQPGTVICANDVLYVARNLYAFRRRATGPRGGQKLFVLGDYSGQLSARGETLWLLKANGETNATLTYPGDPSPAQQYLRITELMYHPIPLAGNTNDAQEFEFLELKNLGPSPLNLTGVRFTNGIDFVFTGPAVTNLGPGQTLILARNPTAFTNRYGGGFAVVGPYDGSLDNGGERLQLLDAMNEEILDFTYNNAWYRITDGLGFALVVANENAAPDAWGSPTNWRAGSQLNGSPGRPDSFVAPIPAVVINEVLTRTDTPPPTDSIELFNPTAAPADLSGWYLTDDFYTPMKYPLPPHTFIPAGGYVLFDEFQFNPAPGVPPSFALGADGDEVYLFAADTNGNLTGYFHGFDFGPADNGVSFGRQVTSEGKEHFVAQAALTLATNNAGPRPSPVVLTEIMYHPPASETNDNAALEFLELFNATTNAVPLFDPADPTNTWALTGGANFRFPTNLTLAPGAFLVLVNFDPTNTLQRDAFQAQYGLSSNTLLCGPLQGRLNNAGDQVELKRPVLLAPNQAALVLMDQVTYQPSSPWPAGANGYGLSLQRRSAGQFGNEPTNWVATLPTAGAATVVSGLPPAIQSHPLDRSVTIFQTVSFSVSATGDPPLRYQWQWEGVNLPGATNATLILANVQSAQGGGYRVIVYNQSGSVESRLALLTVAVPATILQQPQSVSLRGSTNSADYGATTNNATFSVVASSSSPLAYQWRRNGRDLPGATNASLTVTNVTLADEGIYDVVVSSAVGSIVSAGASLTVLLPVGFVETPLPTNWVVLGGHVTVSTVLRGTPPFLYQWRKGSTPLTNLVSWDNQGFFTLTNVQSNQTGLYRVVVTNVAYPYLNLGAAFYIMLLPDADRDGLPDAWEVANGLNTNNVADALLDSDGDGLNNLHEYVAGTNPQDARSFLKLEWADGGGGGLLRCQAVSNRTYAILRCDGLDGPSGGWLPWTNLVARPTNRLEILQAGPAPTNRFFRLRIPAQP